MEGDLPEGEPRRAEHVFRRSGTGGRRSWGPAWTSRPWRPWAAVAAICAVLAIATGRPGWTLLAALSCLAGLTLLAASTGFRVPLLPLRSWWARWSWRARLAIETRFAPNARWAVSPWRARLGGGVGTRRPRRARRTLWPHEGLTPPRRARLEVDRHDEAEGQQDQQHG